jgi:hypothetical protein
VASTLQKARTCKEYRAELEERAAIFEQEAALRRKEITGGLTIVSRNIEAAFTFSPADTRAATATLHALKVRMLSEKRHQLDEQEEARLEQIRLHIQFVNSVAERHAERVRNAHAVGAWSGLVALGARGAQLVATMRALRFRQQHARAAAIIRRCVRRRLFVAGVKALVQRVRMWRKSTWRLEYQVRLWRKRRAAARLRVFLAAAATVPPVKLLISRVRNAALALQRWFKRAQGRANAQLELLCAQAEQFERFLADGTAAVALAELVRCRAVTTQPAGAKIYLSAPKSPSRSKRVAAAAGGLGFGASAVARRMDPSAPERLSTGGGPGDEAVGVRPATSATASSNPRKSGALKRSASGVGVLARSHSMMSHASEQGRSSGTSSLEYGRGGSGLRSSQRRPAIYARWLADLETSRSAAALVGELTMTANVVVTGQARREGLRKELARRRQKHTQMLRSWHAQVKAWEALSAEHAHIDQEKSSLRRAATLLAVTRSNQPPSNPRERPRALKRLSTEGPQPRSQRNSTDGSQPRSLRSSVALRASVDRAADGTFAVPIGHSLGAQLDTDALADEAVRATVADVRVGDVLALQRLIRVHQLGKRLQCLAACRREARMRQHSVCAQPRTACCAVVALSAFAFARCSGRC